MSRAIVRACTLGALVAIQMNSPAIAAENITYTYDAKGRLVKVVHTGAVNNNLRSDYEHDKADNRKRAVVSGSTNPPPQ